MKKAGAKGPEPKPDGDKVSEKVKRVYRCAFSKPATRLPQPLQNPTSDNTYSQRLLNWAISLN